MDRVLGLWQMSSDPRFAAGLLSRRRDHHVVIRAQPRQRAVIFIAARVLVLHARVANVADLNVNIVTAQVLEEIDNLAFLLRPQIDFCERRVVAKADSLAARSILVGREVEPVRLAKCFRVRDSVLWISTLVQVIIGLVEVVWSLVAHQLAKHSTGLLKHRKYRRHSQLPAGLVLRKRILNAVGNRVDLFDSIPQILPVVVQPEEA